MADQGSSPPPAVPPRGRPPGTGGNRLNMAAYNALVAAFRADPSINQAAVAAGVSYRTAQRALEDGFPRRGWKPIRELIWAEAAAGRKLTFDMMGRARAQELRDPGVLSIEEEKRLAAEQRAREGRLSQLARDNTLLLEGMLRNLMTGALELSKRLSTALAADQIPLAHGIRILRDISLMHLRTTSAGQTALEIERLRLGLPSATIGVNVTMTVERAMEVLREAADLSSRAKELGLEKTIGPAPAPAAGTTNGGKN